MGYRIGYNIKCLRKKRNLTQLQMAKKINITRQTLSNYETGKRMPDLLMVIKIADVFDITIDELVGRKV